MIVMRERGTRWMISSSVPPTSRWTIRGVVDHYRAAHAISDRAEARQTHTEEMRQGFVHYRALFEELLEVDDQLRQAHEA
jgi:hypothetical protein